MKNRKTMVLAFVLVALLCVGIGFAALTDELTIAGGISVDAGNNGGGDTDSTDPNTPDSPSNPNQDAWKEDIYFANADLDNVTGTYETFEGEKGTATIVIGPENTDVATITIPKNVIWLKGDTVTFTIDIKNDNEEYDAKITMPEKQTVKAGNGEFEVSVASTDEQNTTTVQKKGSVNYTVTVKVTKTPTEDVSGENAKFTLSFTATTADPATTP